MKASGLYTATIALMTCAFLTYVSTNWGGNHGPGFGTNLEQLIFEFSSLLKLTLVAPILIFSRRDLMRLHGQTLVLTALMAVTIWLCISQILWVSMD